MLVEKHGYKDKKGKNRIRVLLRCNTCGTESWTSIDNYYTACKRNGKDTTYCKACSAKNAGKKMKGRPSKCKGVKKPYMSGANSANWNGGKYKDANGYVMILTDNERGPNDAGWHRYKKEHRVVMEKHLNRDLNSDETIHHIDGNKENNNIDNLDLISKDSIHHKLTHHSLMLVGYELYKRGTIKYDRDKHIYFLEQNEELNAPTN